MRENRCGRGILAADRRGCGSGLAYEKTRKLPILRELIGRSVRRRPIYAYGLGPPGGSPVLVVGCTHGDVSLGMAIVTALRRLLPPVGVHLWLVPAPTNYLRRLPYSELSLMP